MAEPLPTTTLAWLRQTAKFEGAVTAQVLLHLLERVEVLEQRPTCKECLQVAPTPEAALAAEPVGEGPSDEDSERLQWYTYDPEEGVELYSSREQAQSGAKSIMGSYQVNAYSDGWHEDMELASWGALAPVEQAQIVARGPTEPGDECEEWVRYELRPARWGHPTAPPAPEAGEAGELVAELELMASHAAASCQFGDAKILSDAATLLQQLSAPAPVVVPVAPDELEGSNG